MSRTGLVRMAAAVTLGVALGALTAPAAYGHASQTGSTPAAGAVLDSAPAYVEVTFDTPIMGIGAALVVRSSDGTTISAGSPAIERTAIRIDVPADADPGTYTVAFRVVAEDGHAITSTFEYTVAGSSSTPAATSSRQAATPSVSPAAPVAQEGEDSGGPPYAVVGAVLLALTLITAGAIALRR